MARKRSRAKNSRMYSPAGVLAGKSRSFPITRPKASAARKKTCSRRFCKPFLGLSLFFIRAAHLKSEVYLQDSSVGREDRKSTRLNSSHVRISYAVFCLKKKKKYI